MNELKFQRITGYSIDECVSRLNEKIQDGEITKKNVISINWRVLPSDQREKRQDGKETHEELSIFYWGN